MKGKNDDKATFRVPWEQVAFLKKVRKIVGCGSLKVVFLYQI